MNQVTETRQNPLSQLRKDLKSALPTFGMKNEREQERMASVLMVAVDKDPDLVFADRPSLIAAVRQCASHGLVPDGNEATLQVYNTKSNNGWIKKVQYQPMIRGIVNRVLRSGKVLTFWADVVYEGEEFSIDTSEGDRRPKHSPDHFNRTGKIVGVYAVAKMANGAIDCEVMSLKEIEKVKAVAKTKKVWDGWFEEKAKVAVMRRMSKRLPLSAEDMDFIMNPQEHNLDEPKDVTPAEQSKPNLAQQITQESPNADPEPSDQATDTIEGDVVLTADPNAFEFSEGEQAFNDGKAFTACEYEDGSQKQADWQGGYVNAEGK